MFYVSSYGSHPVVIDGVRGERTETKIDEQKRDG